MTKHRNIKDFVSSIKAVLKNYKEDEIKESIDNYDIIVKSPEYYWTHKYGLKDFLIRKGNIDRFLSENNPYMI